jgi:hypothetical protein
MPDFKSFLDYLSTPGGAALTNFAGGALKSYGDYQQGQQQQKQSANQFAATTKQNQFNADRQAGITQAEGVLNADPLGASQGFAQKNALAAAILPNIRNFHSQPGDAGVAGAMGGPRGGAMNAFGPNGLDPKMIDSMFGPDATMASLGQRQKELSSLSPSAPVMDLKPMYGEAAAPQMAQLKQFATELQGADATKRAALEGQLNSYIQAMLQQEQQQGGGSGFWHKFAQIAGIVGAGAAAIMTAGGASPLLAGALAAGSGAASSFGSGGNPLMGAIGGAASSFIGSKLAPKLPGGASMDFGVDY